MTYFGSAKYPYGAVITYNNLISCVETVSYSEIYLSRSRTTVKPAQAFSLALDDPSPMVVSAPRRSRMGSCHQKAGRQAIGQASREKMAAEKNNLWLTNRNQSKSHKS